MKKVFGFLTNLMKVTYSLSSILILILSFNQLRKKQLKKQQEKYTAIVKQVEETLKGRNVNTEENVTQPLFIIGTAIAALAINPTPLQLKRMSLQEVKNLLIEVFGESIEFEDPFFETLFSKKVDKIVIGKFIQVLENLYQDQVVFKSNPIIIDSSTKILEVQVLKDWRLYVKRKGTGYTVCNIGHKNTQTKDIKKLKARYGQIAV